MATMLPAVPVTCGMAMSGGVKPSRAQTGSGLTDGGLAQLAPAFAGEASAGDAGPGDLCAADGCVRTCCGGDGGCRFPLHAVTVTSETVITASAVPGRHLISRRYAGHDAAYRSRPAQALRSGTRTIEGMSATELRFGRAPGAWPLLGHVVALQRRPLALLDSLPAHGDLVQIRLGPRPAYVVCHPGPARQVLTDLRGFDRTGLAYERLRTAIGNGLASAAHQDHRRQRLIMQPAFRREHLRGYVSVMRQEITAAMESWLDGDSMDLVDEMFTLTTTIALRALFSSQLDPDRAELLRHAF